MGILSLINMKGKVIVMCRIFWRNCIWFLGRNRRFNLIRKNWRIIKGSLRGFLINIWAWIIKLWRRKGRFRSFMGIVRRGREGRKKKGRFSWKINELLYLLIIIFFIFFFENYLIKKAFFFARIWRARKMKF